MTVIVLLLRVSGHQCYTLYGSVMISLLYEDDNSHCIIRLSISILHTGVGLQYQGFQDTHNVLGPPVPFHSFIRFTNTRRLYMYIVSRILPVHIYMFHSICFVHRPNTDWLTQIKSD